MAIDSFTALQTFVTAEHELDATTIAQLPDLIQRAEAQLNRLLTTPDMEVVEYASTVAGDQTLLLPTGFRQMRAVLLDDDYPLSPVNLNVLLGGFDGDSASGKPQVYAVANQSLYFGPIPDAAYTVTITCLSAFSALSDTNASNWLLEKHPDAYTDALAYEVSRWQRDIPAAQAALAVLTRTVDQINRQGNRYRGIGARRLRSPVVV